MPLQPAEPCLKVRQVGKVTVATLLFVAAEEDVGSLEVGQELSGLAEKLKEPYLVLNCRGVRQFTSYLFAKLITIHKNLKAAGGRLASAAVTPELEEVCHIIGLDTLVNMYPDEREALKSFRP